MGAEVELQQLPKTPGELEAAHLKPEPTMQRSASEASFRSGSSRRKGSSQVEEAKRGLPPFPHVLRVNEALNFFGTNADTGLTQQQVYVFRSRYGTNALAEKEQKSLWELISEQFEDLLVRILLAAAVVSFVLAVLDTNRDEGITAFVEPLVILLILVANAIVSIWQENNAEKSLEALKKLQPDIARVLRDNHWRTIPAEDLVPGDIVEVRVGDRVPADLRIIDIMSTTIKVEESQLTGESCAVYKTSEVLPTVQVNCEIQAKRNILFGSTSVAHGRAVGLVVATGMATEIGMIQAAVVDAAEEGEPSPLQKKLDEFSQQLSKVIGVICLIVWLININHFRVHGSFLRGCVYYFKIAVALAVAAIPEGLPAVITTCLALGTNRMAKRHAIVRQLQSVETLGCTTVICSDKTGTLTTNEMSVIEFAILDRDSKSLSVFTVEGHSFQPIGRVFYDGTRHGAKRAFSHVTHPDSAIADLVRICAMCNESRLSMGAAGKVSRTGDPTEAALKVLVEKLGCPDANLNAQALQKLETRRSAEVFCSHWSSDFETKAILEFSRERKSMSVLVRGRTDARNRLFLKGAPESVLARCTHAEMPDGSVIEMTPALRTTIECRIDSMASKALRTLAIAMRTDAGELAGYDGPGDPRHQLLAEAENFIRFEQDLTFVGLVGLLDPPRPCVDAAVDSCHQAGIKVIMITGDNKKTAEAIAQRTHILGNLSTSQFTEMAKRVSFTGREFDALSDEDKVCVLSDPHGAIFSRTEPRHKQTIVRLLREQGEVVAMTGDGVNDAPALKQADIGISMGISGTEVAKEASAMILADDNFSTIVSAVEEGRSIYNNMKAFIRYLISSNIGEVASIFFTAALGIPEGLAPVQLLWVNLVTDGMPATALGFNPPDVDVMSKPPRRRNESLITPWVLVRYFTIGIYVGIATVGIFLQYYLFDYDSDDAHSLITYNQVTHFNQCPQWQGFSVNPIYGMPADDPCSYFTAGKLKASTLSLTVLVIIEMLNAFNALSEDFSLVTRKPWSNPSLCVAAGGSVLLHCVILYVEPLSRIFGVTSLSLHDWYMVVAWSVPVILIDEVLKFTARHHKKLQRGFAHIISRGRRNRVSVREVKTN